MWYPTDFFVVFGVFGSLDVAYLDAFLDIPIPARVCVFFRALSSPLTSVWLRLIADGGRATSSARHTCRNSALFSAAARYITTGSVPARTARHVISFPVAASPALAGAPPPAIDGSFKNINATSGSCPFAFAAMDSTPVHAAPAYAAARHWFHPDASPRRDCMPTWHPNSARRNIVTTTSCVHANSTTPSRAAATGSLPICPSQYTPTPAMTVFATTAIISNAGCGRNVTTSFAVALARNTAHANAAKATKKPLATSVRWSTPKKKIAGSRAK